jgi:hypothetical protein
VIRSLILMSVVACSHAAPSLRWAVIAKAPTLRVDVERTQYIDPGGEHRGGNCYLHVRLTNTSSSTIGVDLRSGAPTIYPSCFGAEKDPAAVTVIDCIEEVVEPLAASEQSRLLADFRAHRLTELGPGSSADYFREFNGTPDGECDTAADGTVPVSLHI